MRKLIALLLVTLLAVLGLPGTGRAQSSVQVQGTIQAVDCQAQTVVLSAPGNSNTIAVAPYTAVLVNSTSVPFCTLVQYLGAPASAWLVASGSEFVATRIDVVGRAAVAPVAPAPVTVIEEQPLPIEGIVLGTIFVAGLLFLLTRDNDDHFYRYPYYGAYYHHYYRPEYRPYRGYYPPEPPVITVPQRVAGTVLGTTTVGGHEFLIARDHDGRVSRYPYYGPYHRYYYRPEYQPYRGDHHEVPVRQGDVRWDPPVYRDGHNNQGRPELREVGGPAPYRQGDPRWTLPISRDRSPNPGSPMPYRQSDPRWNPQIPRDGRPNQGDPAPYRQSDPRWSAPPRQHDPSYTQPHWNPPTFQNDRRRNVPGYPQPSGRCDGPPNQSCSR